MALVKPGCNSWTQNKKNLSYNLDNDHFFALMINSAKVETQADPVIFRCLPSRVRLTFLAGAISNNHDLVWSALLTNKTTKADVTPYPVRYAESPYNNITAEKGKAMNALLVHTEFPNTFWSYKHALKFIRKKAAFPLAITLAIYGYHYRKVMTSNRR